ncbi:hypothetical protein [Pseudomonas sp. Gutcm_11s]|uniref:hypothetical protein n=1 Tax=Pseudomonas sp. Gutcm_11s TaxID=3026088 RepID=UPI0023600ED3|nr:hypothetical protein [Pseudomonas sp. Gutcm_11s]MDD0842667.1 hypothetical protein [Pseudomonas sp. Gutcm_11s]
MEITVTESGNKGWLVKLGGCDIPFRRHADAEQFVERLQRRLEAPHQLPELSHTPVIREVDHCL